MDRREREALDQWLTTEPWDKYEPVIAPCGTEVWGVPDDIDSGLRKHIDMCDECQKLSNE